jgi:hypothetical protein
MLLLTADLMASGSIVPAARPQGIRVQAQNNSQDQPAIRAFKGKILSQNGQRFILRDDVNEVWYHLDDQQQAGKFLGKNVVVMGILDGSTGTIRVRSIAESDS